jgi:menaquinone-dependent protoporphyrinogen oxidase
MWLAASCDGQSNSREANMCEVPVFYATSEGQTRRVAEYVATKLREQGLSSKAIDITSPEARSLNWGCVSAAIVGASVHAGTHQRSAAAFIREFLDELNTRPSLFISVSLSISSKHQSEVNAARAIAQAFPMGLGWRPQRVVCVAGRLAYTQYGFLKRFIMRRIAAKQGGPTDTSRDYEMTDWETVRSIAEAVAAMIPHAALSA